MSDTPQGDGWWQASDGRWYPPSQPPGVGWWRASDGNWYPPQAQPGSGTQEASGAPDVVPRGAGQDSGGSWYQRTWSTFRGWPIIGQIGTWVGLGFVVLIVIAAIAGPPPEENDGDEVAADTTTTSEEPEETTEPPASTTTETTTTTTTSTTTTTVPPPAVRRYQGAGDDVIQIRKPDGPDSPAIVTLTHQGGANFIVESLNADLQSIDLLVNAIGTYTGTVPLDFFVGESTRSLQISADGAWQIQVRSITDARQFEERAEGIGDEVIFYSGDTATLDLTHSGSANFIVEAVGDSSDLLVNEIGVYNGTVPLPGESYVIITADGAWTMRVQ